MQRAVRTNDDGKISTMVSKTRARFSREGCFSISLAWCKKKVQREQETYKPLTRIETVSRNCFIDLQGQTLLTNDNLWDLDHHNSSLFSELRSTDSSRSGRFPFVGAPVRDYRIQYIGPWTLFEKILR